MNRFFAGALVLCLAGCATVPPPAAPIEPWDSIAFELKSWGRPMVSWTVTGTGDGLLTETVAPEGAPFGRYDLVSHAFDVTAEQQGELSSILGQLPSPAPDIADCKLRATDMPYGALVIERGPDTVSHKIDVGCRDADYQAYVAVLKRASDLVETWGKAAPVLRAEQVGLPGSED